MTEIADINTSLAEQEREAETRAFARILADNYAEFVAYYVREFELSVPDALNRVEKNSSASIDRVLNESPKQTSWHGLGALEQVDPELALKRWVEIKNTARDEIVSGHDAADQFEYEPYARARFLVIRESFIAQWKPANAGECLMVDMLAQSYSEHSYWLGVFQSRSRFEIEREREQGKGIRRGKLKATTIEASQSLEQAGAMVDRFNRLFLRTLRGLRDLRRYNSSVTIQNAGQVNIAEQQVNAAKLENKIMDD